MPLRKSDAIILKQYNYADADRIVHFLTEDRGLIHGYARGVRRLRSRLGGRIDLLNRGQIIYFEKSEEKLARIDSFDLVEAYQTLKTDLPAFYRAMIMVELVHQISKPNIIDRQLYKIFISFLEVMDRYREKNRLMLLLFEFFIIHHEGYAPSFQSCSICGEKPVFPLYWSLLKGMICSNCHRPDRDRNYPIEEELALLFKIITTNGA